MHRMLGSLAAMDSTASMTYATLLAMLRGAFIDKGLQMQMTQALQGFKMAAKDSEIADKLARLQQDISDAQAAFANAAIFPTIGVGVYAVAAADPCVRCENLLRQLRELHLKVFRLRERPVANLQRLLDCVARIRADTDTARRVVNEELTRRKRS